jgi:hypothetical protein
MSQLRDLMSRKKYDGDLVEELWPHYRNRMATETNIHRCDKCQGTLRIDTDIDFHSGLRIETRVCLNCGRRTCGDAEPRPLSA